MAVMMKTWMNSSTITLMDLDTGVEMLVPYEEAFEFFEVNIQGAYVGEHTPLYVHTIDDEE